ncbi:MAG: DNA methylase [Lachnospiraceae bacterium]|nr:DNA methylase [Lachnospiraceae bacterium]
MPEKQRTYACIDLKSFYASVECSERGLNPMTTNLVVADMSRTEKTICLAVSPSLKSYGISGRARLFEVVSRVKEVNEGRRRAYGKPLTGESAEDPEVKAHPELALSYIVAPPRMSHYVEVSTQIYQIYLRYIAPEDMLVYSIDEVFLDLTAYLNTYQMTAHELVMKMIREVLSETGITATAGIGTNLYLAKIAMDVMAKKMPADADGVRIAELDEMSYRRNLWDHVPITDFWRIGRGYERKLSANGMYTLGDVARCSLTNEDLLYHLFGVNAELLIDHAWGYEPCTMEDVHAYQPQENSVSSGQVLMEPYPFDKTRLIVREMTDLLALDLVEKRLVTDQLVLTIGYDSSNLSIPEIRDSYQGPVTKDRYGKLTPKHAHGTVNLGEFTSSTHVLLEKITELYEEIANPLLLSRRITIGANHLISEEKAEEKQDFGQMDLFSDFALGAEDQKQKREDREREKRRQMAVLEIQKKFGKNAILKGMNLEEGATTKQRNSQIGGHKA